VRDGNAAAARLLAEFRQAVAKCLRPSDRRGVLRADSAAHGQDAGADLARHVEHHADIAPVAHAAGAHHGRSKRFFDRKSEAQQQWARTVISADAVLSTAELRAQQHLSEFVPARGKLIENLARLQEREFFEIIQRARSRDMTQDAAPVDDIGIGRRRNPHGICDHGSQTSPVRRIKNAKKTALIINY
jgi:hypothetical protein